MATGEENAPLLSNTDDFTVTKPQRSSNIKSLYETNHLFKKQAENSVNDGNQLILPNSNSLQNIQSLEQDCVVSIFVIAFDTKAGKLFCRVSGLIAHKHLYSIDQ